MTMRGWVGAVSGLASLLVDGPVTVQAGGRVLAHLPAGQHLVADALGEPGVPTVYAAGSESVTLTRAVGDWWGGVVTTMDGRAVPGVGWEDTSDKVAWKSGVATFNPRVRRWPVEEPARTGDATFTVDPGHESVLWDVLRAHSVLVVAPAAPTVGVGLRCVTVESVTRERLSDDLVQVDVSWVEVEPVSGGCPVVTWGEWAAYGVAHPEVSGWRAWSALEVARRVSGMPV